MSHKDFKEHVSTDKVNMGIVVPHGTIGMNYVKEPNKTEIRYTVLKNRYDGTMNFQGRTNDDNITNVRRDLKYPQLIFDILYNLENNRVINSKVYMIDPRLTIENVEPGQRIPLYGVPLPNIYQDNRICHGNNNDHLLENPESMIASFYNTMFNTDLIDYIPSRLPTSTRESYNEKNLEDKINYLITILNESNNNIEYPQTHWLTVPRGHIANNEQWKMIERIR